MGGVAIIAHYLCLNILHKDNILHEESTLNGLAA